MQTPHTEAVKFTRQPISSMRAYREIFYRTTNWMYGSYGVEVRDGVCLCVVLGWLLELEINNRMSVPTTRPPGLSLASILHQLALHYDWDYLTTLRYAYLYEYMSNQICFLFQSR